MKVALAQLNYHIGNFEDNFEKICRAISDAKAQNADLVVFAELAISGYPPRDFLHFEEFVAQCDRYVDRIADECHGIAAIVGAPSINPSPKGKRLHNTAYFLKDGKVAQKVHKTLLPTYDIFDEYRYFEPNQEFNLIEYQGAKIALTICEDIWNIGQQGLYQRTPMEEHADQDPDIMINIAASPFSMLHQQERKQVLQQNATTYGIPIFYVNHVGAQTELIFDGGSMVMDATGQVVSQCPTFQEVLKVIDTENLPVTSTVEAERLSEIRKALVLGIRDYFRKSSFENAVIGLSGGIDSALTLVLAVEALGPEHVKAIMMPSAFSSDHSIADSVALCNNLGCACEEVAINEVYDRYNEVLAPLFEGRSFDVTEENLQARIRGTLLMAVSNKFGNILLNTSNKSEMAVGYGTLYGDMCGGLSVLGDLYKTDVFALCRHINEEGEIIPENIITKPPSAELRPDQKDSDSLPDYDLLDQVLFQYIEAHKSAAEIVEMGYDVKLVEQVMRMVNRNEYKRFQAPPILRITNKAFGMGRRMPIVGKYLS